MNHYNSEGETWDLEIKPKVSLFSLNLKEVWHYRDLMLLFVKRDFVAQYKQTILGPLWHVIQPILTTLMFLLIFGKIANIPTDGIPPVLFYMSGVTIWNYFSGCLTATSNTFVANAGIFGKVYFPRLVLPLSIVFSNIARLGIQFGILIIAILYYALFKQVPVVFGSQWLLLPLLVILMAGISLGLGIIISSLTTKYRDFSVLITFGIQLLMYATPVVYPLSFLSNKSYAWIIYWNPLSAIVEGFRFALFHTGSFTYSSLLYPFIFMIVVLLFGAMYFNKVERTFMDTV
ncbi:MAG: ABC transporter permease [Sphingobacteriales bacterium]|nr:MAG: ABC transporter permease [Sphingobacteriales bacterium]